MSKIRSKDTKLELTFRKALYKTGFRYRIHNKKIIGTPDIVNKKLKVAIFINGCFWHNHNCKIGHIPKSNINFWKKKIENNIKRDSRIKKTLKAQGWKVIYVWECKINSNLNKYIKKLFTRILIN